MVKIADIIQKIEEFAPLALAEDFDNCGLKIGNVKEEVAGILVTVDTDLSVIREAKEKGCNFILEHHPSIWHPLKKIDVNVPLNAALIEAAKNDIAIYSAHTNVDYTEGGLNDYVAEKMLLSDVRSPFGPSSARVGFLNTNDKMSLKQYACLLARIFDDDSISVVGDPNKPIGKVAVINGGGGGREDVLWATYSDGCDVFVTAEVKHNVARLANSLNYAIIQFSHYKSEADFMPLMQKILQKAYPVPVYCAESVRSPFISRGEIWN